MFDNGPQFIASEFVYFLKQNGVKQTLAAPYHPSSNGAAERTVQTLTQALQKEAERVRRGAPKRSLKHQLANCLFQYRNTPHSVTGVTPAELFLKRNPRTKFSVLKPNMEMHIQNQQGKLQQQHDKSNAIQYSNKIKSLCLKNNRTRYTRILLKISVKAIKKSGSRVSKCALSRIRPRVWNLKIKSTSSGAQTS